jgi:hypothetical protein
MRAQIMWVNISHSGHVATKRQQQLQQQLEYWLKNNPSSEGEWLPAAGTINKSLQGRVAVSIRPTALPVQSKPKAYSLKAKETKKG